MEATEKQMGTGKKRQGMGKPERAGKNKGRQKKGRKPKPAKEKSEQASALPFDLEIYHDLEDARRIRPHDALFNNRAADALLLARRFYRL